MRKAATAAALDVETPDSEPISVQDRHLLYVPAVLGMGRLHFVDRRRKVDEREEFALLAEAPESAMGVTWERAHPLTLTQRELIDRPEPDAYFDELPASVNEPREFKALKKSLADYLYHNSSVTLLYSPVLKSYSLPQENERDFRMRLQQAARERRDEEVDKINQRYEKRLQTLGDRLRRAEASLGKKRADAEARKRETLVSVGESVVGMFLGRRSTRAASTALSKHRLTSLTKMQVEEAEETLEALQHETKELEQELQEQVTAIKERWEETLSEFEEVPVTPRRTDIQVDLFALAWAPHWQITYQDPDGATRTELVPAF